MDCAEDMLDNPFMAVMTDMTSLNDEMISEVDDVFFCCVIELEYRLDTDERGVVLFVMMRFYK